MDLLDRLLEHDRWATTQLLELCRGLTDAQLDHQIPNLAFWTGVITRGDGVWAGRALEHLIRNESMRGILRRGS